MYSRKTTPLLFHFRICRICTLSQSAMVSYVSKDDCCARSKRYLMRILMRKFSKELWPVLLWKLTKKAGLGICSFAHRLFAHWSFAHLLQLLRTNEWMWAIHSGRSGQMSNCERIAQVPHDKWANVSNSLRLLRTNEPMSESLSFFLSKSLIFSFAHKKLAIC